MDVWQTKAAARWVAQTAFTFAQLFHTPVSHLFNSDLSRHMQCRFEANAMPLRQPFRPPRSFPLLPQRLLPLLLRLLHDLLDDLLLLDQEGTHDAVFDAVGAAAAAVRTLDGLLRARDVRVLAWAPGGDLC